MGEVVLFFLNVLGIKLVEIRQNPKKNNCGECKRH